LVGQAQKKGARTLLTSRGNAIKVHKNFPAIVPTKMPDRQIIGQRIPRRKINKGKERAKKGKNECQNRLSKKNPVHWNVEKIGGTNIVKKHIHQVASMEKRLIYPRRSETTSKGR